MKKQYGELKGKFDPNGANLGLPDKFTLECVEQYFWEGHHYVPKVVSTLCLEST